VKNPQKKIRKGGNYLFMTFLDLTCLTMNFRVPYCGPTVRPIHLIHRNALIDSFFLRIMNFVKAR